MTTFESIKEQALSLPFEEQEALLDVICENLGTHAKESVERAWLREAEETWAAIESGEEELVDGEQVLAEMRMRAQQPPK